MIRVSDRELLKEKLYWLESVKEIELNYHSKLQEKSNDIRKIRHDFKGTLDSVLVLINEDTPHSREKAKALLNSLNDRVSATKLPIYTKNLVANAVISAKIEEANKLNTNISVAVDLSEQISIEEIDINCVFLNLLNNAIDACQKLPAENRKILLKATIQAGYLIIKTENPYLSIETDNKGKFKSTKENKSEHGFGLSLIEDIAKKYDGYLQIDTSNNTFTAIVSLKAE